MGLGWRPPFSFEQFTWSVWRRENFSRSGLFRISDLVSGRLRNQQRTGGCPSVGFGPIHAHSRSSCERTVDVAHPLWDHLQPHSKRRGGLSKQTPVSYTHLTLPTNR